MPFMEQGNFRLYYEDSNGDKPAILFLHGAGGNHVIWSQQVPAFVDTYRCITVDQRSFGQSLDVPNGPGCTALASDALALMDHLQLDRAALVTQSMGGWTAVGAAVQQPQRFWAIVLANTVGNLTDPAISALRDELQATRPERPPVLWQGALGATFQKREPTKSFLYAQLSGLNPPRSATFRDQLYSMSTPVERYTACGIPTLFITGDEDILVWPELSELVQSKVAGSRLLRVPEAGHSVYFEQPELFNREVGAFLQAHRPVSSRLASRCGWRLISKL
jgi:3-oxoadipate enol-lactonase